MKMKNSGQGEILSPQLLLCNVELAFLNRIILVLKESLDFNTGGQGCDVRAHVYFEDYCGFLKITFRRPPGHKLVFSRCKG